MATITLRSLGKRFPNGTVAVRAADFTIEDGEFFILVGPSGCGKSTLLSMIAGLERPSEGAILMDGRRIDGLDPKDRDMAMVFQSYALYPHMSVRENLAFPLKLAKRPKREIARRVEASAQLLQLEALLDRRPASLSGGQRQRVAIGRALVREPAAFLMDEPLSNLDAQLRVQMRTELARLQHRLGTTTIYVTHDQTEAMTLGDRVAVMRDGEIQQLGTPRQLYGEPANLFVAGFIGSPAINLLPARGARGRVIVPTLDLALPHPVPEGQRLVVGIRPESLHEADHPGAGEWPAFTVRVSVLEWLGADLYAYFDLPGADVPARSNGPAVYAAATQGVARLQASSRIAEGAPLRLAFNPARAHLFDADSGQRLAPRP